MLQSLELFSPFNVGISQNSVLDPNIVGNIVGYTMVYYIHTGNMTNLLSNVSSLITILQLKIR